MSAARPPANRPQRPPGEVTIAVRWGLRARWPGMVPLLRRVARHVLAAEGFHSGHLSIAVVGQQAMSTLHERFLRRRGPTDVLAFDLGSLNRHGYIDAEIVLCSDVALQFARRRGNAWPAARAELALYLTHGILHVAGYNDHSPRGFERMHGREDELLRQLGLGPVFSGSPRRQRGPQRTNTLPRHRK